MNDHPRKAVNKKIVGISLVLFLWPIIAPIIILMPIYSFVGSTLDQTEIDARLAVADIAIKTILILLPISWVAGIVLLIKKLRT